MSDHSVSIVPQQSFYPENKDKAKVILDWLISEDIINSSLTDCVLGAENGYAISEGAKKFQRTLKNYHLTLLQMDFM